MKFTPGQVREILKISQDTYRHWKGTLPPLAGRNGYTPCLSPGDLSAMAAIWALTEDAGIRVGSLRVAAGGLFEHCDRDSWAALERSTLVIELSRGRVVSVPETQPPPATEEIAVVLPCRPIIAALRERLLMEQADTPQGALRFPPTALANARRKGEAS
jgi:hypothetical protein